MLWARASRGRDVLPQELAKAGASVEELVVYQNLDVDAFPEQVRSSLENGEVDWVCLSSPSIARGVAGLLSETRQRLGTSLNIATISPVTSAAARSCGLPVNVEATTFTWDGIFEAIERSMPAVSTDLSRTPS